MKKEAAEAWSKALRSGNYIQTREHLRKPNASGRMCHCALGVLCDVYDSSKWNGSSYAGTIGVLPEYILRAADIKDPRCEVEVNFKATDIPTLNDEGATFAEIADIIDANWKLL